MCTNTQKSNQEIPKSDIKKILLHKMNVFSVY